MVDKRLEDEIFLSTDNDFTIRFSTQCGCFSCIKKFKPSKITHWEDDGATAVCPECGETTVVPSSMVDVSVKHLRTIKNYFSEMVDKL